MKTTLAKTDNAFQIHSEVLDSALNYRIYDVDNTGLYYLKNVYRTSLSLNNTKCSSYVSLSNVNTKGLFFL